MKPSLERLVALAATTGFRVETLEKAIRLGDIVADVGRHPLLSPALALKGGSALNLCFGEPRRLSVDLDFNYVASVDRARMVEDRPEVERAIETIASGQGYRVQRHAGRKLFLGYAGAQGTADRIEVDLNFLFRLPLHGLVRASLWQPGDLERPAVTIVGLEELSAGKLCALLDRLAPRDLFDVGSLPRIARTVWRTRRFRRLFVALAGTLPHPLHSYGHDRLTRVTDRSVVRELHPLLMQGERPAAAELRRTTWDVIGPLLALATSSVNSRTGSSAASLRRRYSSPMMRSWPLDYASTPPCCGRQRTRAGWDARGDFPPSSTLPRERRPRLPRAGPLHHAAARR